MKNLKSPTRRLSFAAFAGLFLFSLSSCVKENNNYYNPPVGYLAVVQASPDEPPLNFTLNGNLVNQWPMQFGDFTYYVRCYTGTRIANFDNAYTGGQLISDSIHITQNQNYSLFLANTSSHPQYLYLTDTLAQPAAGMASIRFINLGPDAGAVDLIVQGTSTSITNKSFLGHSGFTQLTAGSYTLQVNQTGTTTGLASLANVNLYKGGVYTIWLQGLKASTGSGDKLSINLMQNAQD